LVTLRNSVIRKIGPVFIVSLCLSDTSFAALEGGKWCSKLKDWSLFCARSPKTSTQVSCESYGGYNLTVHSVVWLSERTVTYRFNGIFPPPAITCSVGADWYACIDSHCSELNDEVVKPVVTKERLKGSHICTAGNPITIANGNKYQQEWLLDSRFSLPLSLSYNSADQQWRHSWQFQFGLSDNSGDKASLIRPDGKGFGFTKTNDIWSTFSDLNYKVEAFDDGAGSAWKVTSPSGTTEIYNDQAQLLSLITLQNQQYSLSHTDNSTEITGPFGDKLLLEFNDSKQLTQTALNGTVQSTLVWDNDGRLQSRTDAQNQTSSYHYEDSNFPNHLTGITGADGQRFATWAYDSEGRGILSEHAGEERATLQFNDDGSTTVTNSLGKQTTYHFTEIEGVKRPTQVEGHATANCVGANQNYSYDALGRLQSKTDWQGRETRYEYNDRHLVTRTIEAANTPEERITEQQWHSTLPLLLERTQQGRTETYQYNEQYQLIHTEQR